MSDLANLDELTGVELLWFTHYYDGPVAGLASFEDREYWFSAAWDEGRDTYTDFPRLFVLYALTEEEAAAEWADHRSWAHEVGGRGCLHRPPCATNPDPAPDALDRWYAEHPWNDRPDHTNSPAVGWFSDGQSLPDDDEG
jgi:hypothetical protein